MSRDSSGIAIKKKYGQHFLRNELIVQKMVQAVHITKTSNIFEIGCGDGFLTQEILRQPIARLWVFEIDPEWADYVRKKIPDDRLHIFNENILDVDFSRFEPYKPWILLANLPYQITFPIFHMLVKNRHLLQEGVVMVQEEVAQKLTKTKGRGFGFISLFFQHYFHMHLMDKIPPTDFYPPPKVNSRLIYLKPREHVQPIVDEERFWSFIKLAFRQPRRTLKNNLIQTHFALEKIPENILTLRSEQLSMEDFLQLWKKLG